MTAVVTTNFEAVQRLILERRRSGRVYVAGCGGESLWLRDRLVAAPDLTDGATFAGVWIPGVNRFDYAGLPGASSETIFIAPEFEASFRAGRARFFPTTYLQTWVRLGAAPFDAAFVQTSAPDGRGFVSLGVSADFSPALLARADVFKIALVNPAMPAPEDSPLVPLDAFDRVLEAPCPLVNYPADRASTAFDAIADHVARLLADGDTLQFGLGAAQFAILKALSPRRGLRIHSGMVSTPVIDAIACGAIADEVGAVTTGVALGDARLYDLASRDRRFAFRPVAYTHALETLKTIPGFTAVNSAVEVDLFGQANGEFLRGRQISGAGGLVDFLRGAAAAPGGRPIIALPATADGGRVSRITPRLDAPAVTVGRADAGLVVTEFGVADLRGLDVEARARALIAIAHPEHRAALGRAWTRMKETP